MPDQRNIPMAVITRNDLIQSDFDYMAMSYTDNVLTSTVYKTGGASGTVVATLVFAYEGDNLISVTRM